MEQNVSKIRRIILLIIGVCIAFGIVISIGYVPYIEALWLRIFVNCAINLTLGIIIFIIIKIEKLKPDWGFLNYKSYIIGIIMAVILIIIFGIIPPLFGKSLAGDHNEFVLWITLFYFFYYLLVIGLVEELVFRVFVQDTLIEILPKWKWISVIIAAILFGLIHLPNGTLFQVGYATIIGAGLGFAKYYIKNCKFSSVAIAHGLYNFLLFVTTMVLIK